MKHFIFSHETISIFILFFLYFIILNCISIWSLQYPLNHDVIRYESWARDSYVYGYSDVYSGKHLPKKEVNQPPGTIFILNASYTAQIYSAKLLNKILHQKAGTAQWMNGPLLHFMIRLPSLIAHILIGVIIYFFVKEYTSKKRALFIASIFIFTLPLLYNSSMWGQMDSLNNFFFFLSIYFLHKSKYLFSTFFCVISIYIKLSLLPLLPFYLYLLYKSRKNTRSFTVSLLIPAMFLFLCTFLFSTNPLWFPTFASQTSGGELQYISNYAFNFWWMIYFPSKAMITPNSSIYALGLPLYIWGYILTLAFYGIIIWKFLKFKNNIKDSFPTVLFTFFLIAFLSFLFLPQMHERYLYPIFPFLLTYIGITGKKYISYFILALLHLWNIVIIWTIFYPPYFPYFFVFNSVAYWAVSLLMCSIFIFFMYEYLFRKQIIKPINEKRIYQPK